MLTLLSYYTALQNMAAAAQAACSSILDFTVGSPFRALLEAVSSGMMWLQWQLLQLMANIRAATSTGAALDTWMADFSFVRLPGTPASGNATFSRYVNSSVGFLPAGISAKTQDGTQTFIVGVDTTNAYWNGSINAYQIPATVSSVTVPVVATVAGTAGNIQAATLTLIATAVPGIDTVTNAAAFVNGIAPEADTAFRARFALYIAGLRAAIPAAIASAIASVQQGLIWLIVENYNYSGGWQPGYFTVYVDDGTGSPPSPLLTQVAAAIDAVRGATIQFGVFGPTVETAAVAMTITTATGYTHATVAASVQTAITAAIDAGAMGGTLSYTSLIGVAYTIAGVTNVTGYTLNSGTADLAGVAGQVIRAGAVVIT